MAKSKLLLQGVHVAVICQRRKSGLVVGVLNSCLEDRGLESHPMLDGNCVKAMPGSISSHNPGSLIIKKKEKKGSQMGHTKKNIKKNTVICMSCDIVHQEDP